MATMVIMSMPIVRDSMEFMGDLPQQSPRRGVG
jgi:hypothetical protein